MADTEILDNTALHRFELRDGSETAFVLYSKNENSLRLIHTEVPDALRGKGIGSKLLSGVLQLAERDKLSVIPACPFVGTYVKRHPEHMAIIDPQYKWMVQSSE
jgi:predicted GNAT family acetyltransferase